MYPIFSYSFFVAELNDVTKNHQLKFTRFDGLKVILKISHRPVQYDRYELFSHCKHRTLSVLRWFIDVNDRNGFKPLYFNIFSIFQTGSRLTKPADVVGLRKPVMVKMKENVSICNHMICPKMF